MIGMVMCFVCGGVVLVMLVVCGNMSSQDLVVVKLVQVVWQIVDSCKVDVVFVEVCDFGQMVVIVLWVNLGSLIMVGLESQGLIQVMVMIGENVGQCIYMMLNEQVLVLCGGMLVGMCGLGYDLLVVEFVQLVVLICVSCSGQVSCIMCYWIGDGLECLMMLSCFISFGFKVGVMLESCQNGLLNFQNNYLVQGGCIIVLC